MPERKDVILIHILLWSDGDITPIDSNEELYAIKISNQMMKISPIQ